ncbi:MAG: hypothetical protein QG640_162 [Patescibacteria group bacterium]|nr:hypothetical protein [Patescibacteria group bacterium]
MNSFLEFGVIFTFIYIFAIIAGFRCSSAVEQSPVKRLVAGSIPAAGAAKRKSASEAGAFSFAHYVNRKNL